MLVLKIVQANAVYDPQTRDANALLDKYHTLTEWSSAMSAAGARVSVVQRFHTASRLERDGVTYEFVKDSQVPWLSTTAAPAEFVDAINRHAADVIHVNGLIFPQLVARIRTAVGPRAVIVVQHHGGEFPIRGDGLVGWWRRRRWRDGLSGADGASFTAREQAEPWRAAGVLTNQRIVELVESGTTLRRVERSRARTAIGISGDPLVLWVGRLTTNKDPLTVLDGLEQALPELPNARVAMLFGDDTLIEVVDDRVRSSPALREQVTLAGRISRDEIPNYYGAADIFISGSHAEGSGYALVESMAAGVVPVVTDIPSHRAIAGDAGARWPAGDAEACARALLQVSGATLAEQKSRVLERYHAVLRWEAIASQTIREYQSLVEARRAATP
jgi:glycosyltransferase involved in cell wall biosynthesis